MKFFDGLKSLISGIANERQVTEANQINHYRLSNETLRTIFKTGLGNKIARIKAGYLFKDALVFRNPEEQEFWEQNLDHAVRKAALFMFAFGRGVIVINEINKDLSEPLSENPERYKLDVFSGDMVSVHDIDYNLKSPMYYRPRRYNIRAEEFHHSRVIDFRYVEPSEFDLPEYYYGGISEFELIYSQLVNDGIVERASPAILEKNSTFFYKVKGFKNALQAKQEDGIKEFFRLTERSRSIFGAGLIDSEDDAFSVNQTLTDLEKVDQITLRRLAMVTSIPLAILVGENVKGLNSTGDTEKQVFDEMNEINRAEYTARPVNELLRKIGRLPVKFDRIANLSHIDKIDYEKKAIENAVQLASIGEDFNKYLVDRNILPEDDPLSMFKDEDDGEA